MRRCADRAILAIDPSTRGLAFVFFENGRVLDWGERVRGKARDLETVEQLLGEFIPDLVVIEDPDARRSRRRPRVARLLRSIQRVAKRNRIAAALVPREVVRATWRERGVTRKEEMAAAIASRFDELAAIVPSAKRIGASEDPRVNIFDAASLVMHLFGNQLISSADDLRR